MKKKSLLALLLALMMILSGCALKTVDKEADNAQVIVSVNGQTITKQQVKNAVNNTIAQNQAQNQFYSQFGLTAGYPTDEATVQPMVISAFVENLVREQKAKELGLDQMTEEETAHIQEHAQSDWQSFLSQISQYYLADSGLEGDALTEAAQKYAEEHEMGTLADFVESATTEEMLEKVEAYAKKGVAATEEDLTAELAARVAKDQESFTADPNAYGTAVNNGTATYYAPAGYRMIKHILISYAEEDSKAITEKNTALTDAQTALIAAQAALDGAEEGADTETLKAAVEEAQKTVTEAEEAVKAATDTALANIQEKVDQVYALATAEGADFDALIKEHGSDPGAPANGYAIREGFTDFVEPFTAAAMSLEKVGDVSAPVASNYGSHIIKYVADVEEGPVSLESVRASLQTELDTKKQDEAYEAALTQWIEAADVKTYPEKM